MKIVKLKYWKQFITCTIILTLLVGYYGCKKDTTTESSDQLPTLKRFIIEKEGGGPIDTQIVAKPFNIRLIAKDYQNRTLTTFNGNAAITSTGRIALGNTTTQNFVDGILSSHTVIFSDTGNFAIVATNTNGNEQGISNFFAVIPPVPHILKSFLIESSPGSPIDTQIVDHQFSVRITAQDQFDSTLLSYNGSVIITSTGPLSIGGGTTVPFVNGILVSHNIAFSDTGHFSITAINNSGTENGTSNIFPVISGKQPLAPITNLGAYSSDSNAVGLTWNTSADENLSDFNEYLITVKKPNGSMVTTISLFKGDQVFIIMDLTEGIVYTFDILVTAKLTSQNYSDSKHEIIKWSPAKRFNVDVNGSPINIYESRSSFGVNALLIYDPIYHKPKVVSTSSSDSLLIDLYLKDDKSNPEKIELRSANLYRPTWKTTLFSTIVHESSTLDNPQATPPDSTTYTLTSLSFDNTIVASSRIYYFKSDTENYGRILVEKSTNGTLIWGTSPDRYLSLKISYQTVAYHQFSK